VKEEKHKDEKRDLLHRNHLSVYLIVEENRRLLSLAFKVKGEVGDSALDKFHYTIIFKKCQGKIIKCFVSVDLQENSVLISNDLVLVRILTFQLRINWGR
jgi:hypothetical protein